MSPHIVLHGESQPVFLIPLHLDRNIPRRASSYKAMTSSTAFSGANRFRWLSLILFGLPPRSATKSARSSIATECHYKRMC